MDGDASSKFIGSLTKFLQSLCNGYVEFQRGVELVGHIYLNIDTGEKVDYILHEKVSKNDENSVTFVSNSFHAQPLDKDANKAAVSPSRCRNSQDACDNNEASVIMRQSEVSRSRRKSVPYRGVKRASSPGSDQRPVGPLHCRFKQGSPSVSSPGANRQQTAGPSTTVTKDTTQTNIDMGDMKLEQLSSDELLSLASHVADGTSASNVSHSQRHLEGPIRSSQNLKEAAGQPVWIKQEPADDNFGGPDTGWVPSDSSDSGSNFYPVTIQQNPAYSSNPVFPSFTSISGPSAGATSQQHLGSSQSLPGAPGGLSPFYNPVPGTSQNISSMDPSELDRRERIKAKNRAYSRRHYEKLKQDPQRYALRLQAVAKRKRAARNRKKELG